MRVCNGGYKAQSVVRKNTTRVVLRVVGEDMGYGEPSLGDFATYISKLLVVFLPSFLNKFYKLLRYVPEYRQV